jgi:hypothetical protein
LAARQAIGVLISGAVIIGSFFSFRQHGRLGRRLRPVPLTPPGPPFSQPVEEFREGADALDDVIRAALRTVQIRCPELAVRTRTPVRPTFSAPTISDPMSSPTITAVEAYCAEAAEQ